MSLDVSCDRPASGLTCIGQLNRERTRKEIMDVTFLRLISCLSLGSNCSSRKSLTGQNFRLEMNTETSEFSASVLTQCDNYLRERINFGPVGQSGLGNLRRYRPLIQFERFRLINAGDLTKTEMNRDQEVLSNIKCFS